MMNNHITAFIKFYIIFKFKKIVFLIIRNKIYIYKKFNFQTLI